jgi:hypothetical protein
LFVWRAEEGDGRVGIHKERKGKDLGDYGRCVMGWMGGEGKGKERN